MVRSRNETKKGATTRTNKTFLSRPALKAIAYANGYAIAGGDTGQYEQTLHFANYVNAFTENKEQFARSFIFALLATILALAIAYPLTYNP